MENDIRLAQTWRRRLGLGEQSGAVERPSAEAVGHMEMSAEERISVAGEQMRRQLMEGGRGDPVMLETAAQVGIKGKEAVARLEQGDKLPDADQFSALEVIVAFDGTRPSFLIRNGQVDLESSFSTSRWKTTLAPRLADLAKFAECVGCLEIGNSGIATAFLVSPTLALTNRHVAEVLAPVSDDLSRLRTDVFLDFGREHGGRLSHDRREVSRVVFSGLTADLNTNAERALDVALLEVQPSRFGGEAGDRALPLHIAQAVDAGIIVAVVGYPGDPGRLVPPILYGRHAALISTLLAGDGGSKRLAPGECSGPIDLSSGLRRIVGHDATTINGNSGSPLFQLRAGPLNAVGIHYGGRWEGERINLAYVLGACLDLPVTTGTSLGDALHSNGVAL